MKCLSPDWTVEPDSTAQQGGSSQVLAPLQDGSCEVSALQGKRGLPRHVGAVL